MHSFKMTKFQDDLFESNKQPRKNQEIRNQGLIKLSPSSLNLFLDCKRCFWLYLNKNLKRPGVPVATITTGLDRIVKQYFETFRSKGILPTILKDKIAGKLISRLPNRGWLEYIDKKNNIKLGGYLDECVDLGNNLFAALDHKTRGSAPSEVHSAYQLQMDVYTFLLEQNKFPTKKIAYLVYYIPLKIDKDNDFIFDCLVKQIKTDPERAKKVFLEATQVVKGPIPELNANCGFCNWIKTKETN